MTVTATPKTIRPHLSVAEFQDSQTGYRFWSKPMTSLNLSLLISEQAKVGYELSDVDCSGKCWCVSE